MRKPTPARARSLPRQAASETAEALLAAGERIVQRYISVGPPRGEKPIDILAFVNIDDVLGEATEQLRTSAVTKGNVPARARVSKLTPGAFYRAFPAPDGARGPRRKGEALAIFRRELGRRLVSAEVYRADILQIEEILINFNGPLSETLARIACRTSAADDLARWHDSPTDLLFYGLLLYAKDAEIGCWLRDVNERALGYLEVFWGKWLPRFGRQCRAGITPRQFAATIRATLAVMQIEGRIPESPTMDTVTVTDPDPTLAGNWLLASLAVEGVFLNLTEPIPS